MYMYMYIYSVIDQTVYWKSLGSEWHYVYHTHSSTNTISVKYD